MSSLVPFDDARTLLKAAGLVPDALIHWPNEPFVEPATDPLPIWLDVECVGDVLDPIEMAGGVWQEEGQFYVHVMVPAGTGTDAGRAMAKSIANIYRGLGERNVRYRGASIGNGQLVMPSGTWWCLTVTIDWVYQDIG